MSTFDLERFVQAQDAHGSHDQALRELRAGRKTSHWMWWVFPQLAGLGRSPTAVRYAISGLPEAEAYVAHPVLGPRLRLATQALTAHAGSSASDVLGGIDAMKLRSSLTLFERAAPGEPLMGQVLEQWYGGERDPATLDLLRDT